MTMLIGELKRQSISSSPQQYCTKEILLFFEFLGESITVIIIGKGKITITSFV